MPGDRGISGRATRHPSPGITETGTLHAVPELEHRGFPVLVVIIPDEIALQLPELVYRDRFLYDVERKQHLAVVPRPGGVIEQSPGTVHRLADRDDLVRIRLGQDVHSLAFRHARDFFRDKEFRDTPRKPHPVPVPG